MRQGLPGGGSRDGGGRPATTRPSTGWIAPGFAQRPRAAPAHPFARSPGLVSSGFARSPFFAHSPVFVRSGRYPHRAILVASPFFFVGGGHLVAPWPYWFSFPWPAYAPPQYWAYCQDPEGYYPYVQECPGGWVPVVPTPPAPESWRGSPDGEPAPTEGMPAEDIRAQITRSRAEAADHSLEVGLETAGSPR
jgi:hypothetical protein